MPVLILLQCHFLFLKFYGYCYNTSHLLQGKAFPLLGAPEPRLLVIHSVVPSIQTLIMALTFVWYLGNQIKTQTLASVLKP